MWKNKVLIYYISLFLALAFTLPLIFDIKELLITESANVIEYAGLQKSIDIYGIISFIFLLIISMVIFYTKGKNTYIFLTNILYMVLILYLHVSLNKLFFTSSGIDYSSQSEYWITLFIGVFYIIGAVLVSAISYITARNYKKRFVR